MFRGKFLPPCLLPVLPFPKASCPGWLRLKPWGGKKALQYLSRYLYRGVIADKNIVNITPDQVTFRYQDSGTRTIKRQTLPVLEFLWKVLQHVLPKGFRRPGIMASSTVMPKKLHAQVRQALNAPVPTPEPAGDFGYCCPQCTPIPNAEVQGWQRDIFTTPVDELMDNTHRNKRTEQYGRKALKAEIPIE